MSRKEDLDKLEKAIDKLRPEYREVIMLAKIEELSYSQIWRWPVLLRVSDGGAD
jgi:DNA-directed RNA polymerase specialized sigma24 family protein